MEWQRAWMVRASPDEHPLPVASRRLREVHADHDHVDGGAVAREREVEHREAPQAAVEEALALIAHRGAYFEHVTIGGIEQLAELSKLDLVEIFPGRIDPLVADHLRADQAKAEPQRRVRHLDQHDMAEG